MQPAKLVSGADAVAASALALFAMPVVSAYLLDWLAVPFPPSAMMALAGASGVLTLAWLRPRAGWRPHEVAAFAGTVLGCFAWLMALARPAFLPLGSGPDLTHHLQLISYIERRWRLVHDAGAGVYLGEMSQYTPGSHVLAALAGAWTRTDGLHAVHALVSASVALKAGLVFLIVLRLLPADVPQIPLALTGALLVFVPRHYTLGSFTEDSFFSQVVSELFAVAAWWALSLWHDRPTLTMAGMVAVATTAAFLTWPVWTGTILLVVCIITLSETSLTFAARLRHLALAAGPVLVIAAMYFVGRLGWVGIVRAGGLVLRPLPSEYGWWFLALSLAGLIAGARSRRSRVTVLFIAATGLEALALFALARTRSDDTPYLALKMMYLAVYPQAALAALAIATVWRAAVERFSDRRGSLNVTGEWLAWLLLAALLVRHGVIAARAKPPAPVVSESLFQAGQWARTHLPPGCVDYLVGNAYTAYWLHLAVLGNPRVTARTADNATFEHEDAIVRWLTPGGLPYAIAGMPSLPRDVRSDLDHVADFGDAAVVKRRGPSSCQDATPPWPP